ncbi:unnamed protein product [Polarella glacialis]|nr:unnamed protein product [Polarella glacialis]
MIPFMVYHELRAIGNSAMRQRLKACLEVADYMVEKLTKLRGTEERRAAELKFAPWHPPGVMCVCVSPPPQQMCAKYHLPVFRVQGQVQMTHILTMEHLTKTSVDTFVDEWDAYLVAQKEKDNSKRPSAGGDAWGAVIRRSLTPTGSKFGKINVVGFGTYKLSGDDCAQAVGVAQNTGYSLMDTATVYKNLRLVGELESRVQICHKIDHHITTGRELAEQFEKDLGELGNLSSVHVLMLHYFPKEDCNRQDIWLALLNEKRQGRTKFAGVSNFTIENLQLMFGSKHGDEWPDVVQVHVSVCTQKFIEFCSNMSIDIMVYGVMQNGILEAAKGLLEQGLGVLVSSTRPANIRKNFETLAEYVG